MIVGVHSCPILFNHRSSQELIAVFPGVHDKSMAPVNGEPVPHMFNHMLKGHPVDGRNPAPPIKARNDDSPVHANKQWFQPCFADGAISGFRPSTVWLNSPGS